MSELRTMEAEFTQHSMHGIHEDEEINQNAPISPLSMEIIRSMFTRHMLALIHTNSQIYIPFIYHSTVASICPNSNSK